MQLSLIKHALLQFHEKAKQGLDQNLRSRLRQRLKLHQRLKLELHQRLKLKLHQSQLRILERSLDLTILRCLIVKLKRFTV